MLAKVERVNVLDTKEISFEDVMYIDSLNDNFGRELYRHGRDYYIDRDEYVYTKFIAVNEDWDLVLYGECSLDICRDSGLRGIKDTWLKEVYFRNIKTGDKHKVVVSREEFEKIDEWFRK